MDSLTQIVLGAAVGEVCLGKKVGNKAALWGAIAGTIPDLDVFVKWFTDDLVANEMHRGFSHSILFCLIVAPILGWLIHRLYRKKEEASWKQWGMLSFWALFTHPMLDAHTTWGTQLFWPFDLRLAYKNINVVDPIYTLPFLVLVVLALFFKRQKSIRRRLVWTGIALSTTYLVYTAFIKLHVDSIFKSELERQEISYERITHQPTIFNSILWQATVETYDGYYVGVYSLLDADKNIEFWHYDKNLPLREILVNDYTPYFQRLSKLSDGWFLLESKDSGFMFRDMRFGQISFESNPEDIVFAYEVNVMQEPWTIRQLDPPRDKMKDVIGELFQRVKGIKKPVPLETGLQ